MIANRMAKGLAALGAHWKGNRRPKAFYLIADDWAEFMTTKPPTIRTMFGNNPPRERLDPAFDGVPVRESKGKESRLYDHTTTGRSI